MGPCKIDSQCSLSVRAKLPSDPAKKFPHDMPPLQDRNKCVFVQPAQSVGKTVQLPNSICDMVSLYSLTYFRLKDI